jgi:hypothetical protein
MMKDGIDFIMSDKILDSTQQILIYLQDTKALLEDTFCRNT